MSEDSSSSSEDALFDEDDISSSDEYKPPKKQLTEEDSSSSDDFFFGDIEEDIGSAEGLEGLVENQIEGDFDRLIGSIRNTDDVAAAPMLSRIWDAPLPEDPDMDFHDTLRAASGIGRVGKGKGRRRRRRTGPPLSHQVRALIGEGNQAYVDGDCSETIRIMQEVIRIEPRADAAWSVLATCYRDIGEPLKALQLSVVGAHLRHDPDEWYALATQSRDQGYHQQALYCYRKVYSLDPSNVDALWDRATLAKETGDLKAARNSYLAALKRHPHDGNILNELRHILVELSELDLCTTLFQNAFSHYISIYPTGLAYTQQGEQVLGGGFALMEILILADLFNTLGEYEKAVDTIRCGCRWLQGRLDQRFWDTSADDREYDLQGHVREGNGTSRLLPGYYSLDINARHRLAISRLKLGETEEGKMHAEIVLKENVADFAALFSEIADAYFEQGLYSDAKPIYELLGRDELTSSVFVLLQAAACRRQLGDLKEAADVYEHVIKSDADNNEAKMKLAEIYEIMNEPRKALELVYQVIDSRKRRAPAGSEGQSGTGNELTAGASSLFEERARARSKKALRRISKVELEEMETKKEEEVCQGYERLRILWPAMLRKEEEAENEWLLEAEKLVESFRESRILFLSSGAAGSLGKRLRQKNQEAEEDDMASRLHLDLAQESIARKAKANGKPYRKSDFRTISFDDWLALIIEYAFLLTRREQYDLAEEVLRHILVSSAFQSRRAQDTLRLSLITCAIHERKCEVIVEQSRKLTSAHQFNNEPLRILLAGLASGLLATDSFILSTLQKHVLREMRVSDAIVRGKTAQWNSRSRRYALVGSFRSGDDAGEDDAEVEAEAEIILEDELEKFVIPEKPTKKNPVVPAIYAFTCAAVKSYQSALFYFLMAYDSCRDDPVINLGLAVASVGRAMQRQSDNRNYLVAQAVGFLSRYRKLRMICPDGPHLDEIEFNFGRAFHQLGLFTHAVRHYERVLQMIEQRIENGGTDMGVAKEAAYNLSLILVTTGAAPLAEALSRKWLSI